MSLTRIFTIIRTCALVLIMSTPMLVTAAGPTIDTIAQQLTNVDFKATYTFDTPPPQTIKLYAWIGPADAPDFTTWSRNSYLGNFKPTDTVPFVISKTFAFDGSSGITIVPGKKYGYALVDRSSIAGAVFFNTSGTGLFNCFTTDKANVPCIDPVGGGTGGTGGGGTGLNAICGNAHTQSFSAAPTLGLCGLQNPNIPASAYQASAVTADGAFWRWTCSGLPGGINASCFANNTSSSSGKNIGNSLFDVILNSVQPGSDSVSMDITLKTKDGSSKTVDFSLFMAPIVNGVIDTYVLIANIDKAGTITSTQIQGTVPGLTPNTEYNYEFRELVSESIFGPEKIKTTAASSPNGNGTGGWGFGGGGGGTLATIGVCGSVNGKSAPVVTENTIGLCPGGLSSVLNFSQTSTGWIWKCAGTNGGAASPTCSATLDASAASLEKDGFLKNPFKGIDSFPKLFEAVVNNIVLPVAIPFIAIMIIYSGFLFVLARKDGKVNTLDKAKSTFKYTMIGAALILGAFVIANALQGTLNSILQ